MTMPENAMHHFTLPHLQTASGLQLLSQSPIHATLIRHFLLSFDTSRMDSCVPHLFFEVTTCDTPFVTSPSLTVKTQDGVGDLKTWGRVDNS
jgi:hypothetical protein